MASCQNNGWMVDIQNTHCLQLTGRRWDPAAVALHKD